EAGGILAKSIAKWDGNSWSALGSGVSGSPPGFPFYGAGLVDALAVAGKDLYVGGLFTNAGGVLVKSMAKWSGNSWSALGSGVNEQVSALAISGGDLYVGGLRAGGVESSIAKWNGSSWSALGSGVNDSVGALAVSGNDVYAGGYFTTAG